MKSMIKITLVAISALCLLGMSGFSSASQPQPSNFRAELTDTGERSLSIASATIDGKTTIRGKLGKGRIEVPFDTIERVDFDKSRATIQVRGSAQRLTIDVNSYSQLSGRTAFGNYQIAIRDIKHLRFSKDGQ